jgi:hypothetical protein
MEFQKKLSLKDLWKKTRPSIKFSIKFKSFKIGESLRENYNKSLNRRENFNNSNEKGRKTYFTQNEMFRFSLR